MKASKTRCAVCSRIINESDLIAGGSCPQCHKWKQRMLEKMKTNNE